MHASQVPRTEFDASIDLAALRVLLITLIESQAGQQLAAGQEWLNDRQWLAKKFLLHLISLEGLAKERQSRSPAGRRHGRDASAHNNLGLMDESDWGGSTNLPSARDYYLVALYEVPQARGNLESFHERDLAVPADTAQAVEWYRPAAAAGIAAAQWRLGRLLQARGLEGEERKALDLLDAAAQQGHPAALQDAAQAWCARALQLACADRSVPKEELAEVDARLRGASPEMAVFADLLRGASYEAAERDALVRAASYGQPQAIAAVRGRFGAKANVLLADAPRRWSRFSTGTSNAHREDPAHNVKVRQISSGPQQAALAMDAGLAHSYSVIPWTEQDRKWQPERQP